MFVFYVVFNLCKVFGFDIFGGIWVIINVWVIVCDFVVWKDLIEFNLDRFM